jgi:hypothetical protein
MTKCSAGLSSGCMPHQLLASQLAHRMKVHVLARLAGLGVEDLVALVLRSRPKDKPAQTEGSAAGARANRGKGGVRKHA